MAWHKAPDRTASVRCGKGKALSATPLPGLARPQPDLITVFRETKFHFAKIVNQIITKTKTATPPSQPPRNETKQTALETLRDETKQRFRENFTKNVYESDPWGPGRGRVPNAKP